MYYVCVRYIMYVFSFYYGFEDTRYSLHIEERTANITPISRILFIFS